MKLVNIVATVELSAPLDLDFLHSSIKGTKRNPKVHWLQYRLPPKNTYIAFYKSGKFLVTANSMDTLQKNTDAVLDLLKNVGIDVNKVNIKIHNLVISHHIELESTLENLILALDSKKASYEPEQFPALVYQDWGVNFLLFSTGKYILTGAKTEKQATDAINKFQNLIKKVI